MSGQAPGKAILFGEHAVVYGRPSIAVPVLALQTVAKLEPYEGDPPGRLQIEAPGIGFSGVVDLDRPDASEAKALAMAVRLGLQHFRADPQSGLKLQIQSGIPIASGMGSSAAVTVAVLRAVAELLGKALPAKAAAELAFEVELLHHGTPSGIDNTVVAHATPVYFVKGSPPEPLQTATPFQLVLADSGRPSPTGEMVAEVRERWQADQPAMERTFDEIGDLVGRARRVIERGAVDPPAPTAESAGKGPNAGNDDGVRELGELMDRNHELLGRIGVSTPELDGLAEAARQAGAAGAKLSGAGGGGLVIAITRVPSQVAHAGNSIQSALRAAGAARTYVTQVG